MGFLRGKSKRDKLAADTLAGLRDQALRLSPNDIGAAPSAARPDVWGILMETGYATAAASLVAFADGSASLYFSNGGGIIGAGEHRPVRLAAEELLSSVQQHLPLFVPASSTPLPEVGRVCFYVRTFDGIRTAEASEDDLGHGRHPLSRVFHKGHAMISAMRGATPQLGNG